MNCKFGAKFAEPDRRSDLSIDISSDIGRRRLRYKKRRPSLTLNYTEKAHFFIETLKKKLRIVLLQKKRKSISMALVGRAPDELGHKFLNFGR